MDVIELLPDLPGARWSVMFRDTTTGTTIADSQPDELLPAASVGKLLLLAHLAERLDRNPALADVPLDRAALDPVGDSGLWQHLEAPTMTVADAATLVFSISDNLASNALTRLLGIDEIRSARRRFGFEHSDLFDVVRGHREPDHPPMLSLATAAELCGFMTAVHHGHLISSNASHWLRHGMSLNVDLSLIPHYLGLDPLHHSGPEIAPGVANKTGTDPGVLADTGLLAVEDRVIAYGVICYFADASIFTLEPDEATRMVRQTLHELGRRLMAR